jgi:hypothetical protein
MWTELLKNENRRINNKSEDWDGMEELNPKMCETEMQTKRMKERKILD